MENKRVVLHYTQGAYSGLCQILGTCDQLKMSLKVEELPTFVDNVSFLDHTGECSLVKVTPRYVLYQEVLSSKIRELSESHPEQT